MTTENVHVAFIGLGNMGRAMASHLLQAGYPLTVFNRSPDKAAELAARGAVVAATPAAAAESADVVFTMVSDDAALRQVTTGRQGLLSTLRREAVHVSCSTVAPDTNWELAQLHQKHGSALVAAPVFGKPQAAAEAQLWVSVSGPTAAKERIAPLLATFSQGTHDFGRNVASASVVKLCGNFMLGAAIEAMAEAFTLAEKSGLSRQQVFEMLTSTVFDSPVYRSYGQMIAAEDYKPLGAAPYVLRKDLDLVLAEAKIAGVSMPFASIVQHRLATTVARTAGDEDWTSFARRVSEEAGLVR